MRLLVLVMKGHRGVKGVLGVRWTLVSGLVPKELQVVFEPSTARLVVELLRVVSGGRRWGSCWLRRLLGGWREAELWVW